MIQYRIWHGLCLCGAEVDFPRDAFPVEEPFPPLIFLVRRDPMVSRGWFAISRLEELYEPEDLSCLRPCTAGIPETVPAILSALVAEHGASVLNVAFARAFSRLLDWQTRTRTVRVTLVGLGDVGGAVLTGLALLGREIQEIALYDPNPALCRRYALEMNQLLSPDGRPMPRVTVIGREALFPCDLLIFTASKGVPELGSSVPDVRLAQWAANRAILAPYARQAREEEFSGIFCQVSDPVDTLSRDVFLESSRDESGTYDFAGLLPEQVQGFGLGVMAARAAYYARQEGIPFCQGRVYGPHGQGLVVADRWDGGYDAARSQRLTQCTLEANLQVRALGFKPYLAPGLSSAAISLLQMLRGELHYGAVPLGGTYFGCRSQCTSRGIAVAREMLCDPLMARLERSYQALREAKDP